MKLLKKITLVSLILSGVPLLGHIYKVDKFVKGDKTITCFSDYHISGKIENQINDQQRNDIIEIAKSIKAFMVIEEKEEPARSIKKPSLAEDFMGAIELLSTSPLTFDPNNYVYGKSLLKAILASKNISALYGLSSLCYYAKLPYENIDFRQVNTFAKTGRFGIGTRHAIDCSEKIKREISKYDDNEILNAYYKNVIEFYNQTLATANKFFNCLEKSEGSFENTLAYCFDDKDRSSNDARAQLFCVHNLEFIDARILHTVFKQSQKSNICICTGGAHISGISPLLERIGWRKVIEIGQRFSVGDPEPNALNLQEIKDILLAAACGENKDELQVNKRLKVAQGSDSDIEMAQAAEEQQIKITGIKQELVDKEKQRIIDHMVRYPESYALDILASIQRK